MALLLYIFATLVQLVLQIVYLAMILQAILSWFVPDDNPIVTVLSFVTTPVVLPVRALLLRIPALQRLPIDLSFLVALLLLSFVQSALPPISLPT